MEYHQASVAFLRRFLILMVPSLVTFPNWARKCKNTDGNLVVFSQLCFRCSTLWIGPFSREESKLWIGENMNPKCSFNLWLDQWWWLKKRDWVNLLRMEWFFDLFSIGFLRRGESHNLNRETLKILTITPIWLVQWCGLKMRIRWTFSKWNGLTVSRLVLREEFHIWTEKRERKEKPWGHSHYNPHMARQW